jgi:hypothetical protein
VTRQRPGIASVYRPGGKKGIQILRVIHDPRTEFGILRAAVLATPNLQRIGPDAEIGCGFMGIEFGFAGHDGGSFFGFVRGTSSPAGFDRRICCLKTAENFPL